MSEAVVRNEFKEQVMADELITATEAQDILGITPKTLARLLKSGELPFERDALDRRVKMVKRSDVERLAAKSTRPGKDAA
jgi:hypothetical protein